MRLGAVFIAICMVVIAASAGAIVYLGFGFSGAEAVIVVLAVMTALGLYNIFSSRLGVRSMVGGQISELSRSNFELSRQVNEIGRRLSAAEGRIDSAAHRARAAVDPLAVEISELGTLVRQLAETVATYEARFGEVAKSAAVPLTAVPAPVAAFPAATALAPPPSPPVPVPQEPAPALELVPTPVEDIVQAVSPTPLAAPAVPPPPAAAPPAEPAMAAAIVATSAADEQRLAAIRSAIDANRIDLYLQPIVTLPQRKVRYYEAMSRLRTETGEVMLAAEFVPLAERAGLMPRIDNLVVFRCVQVVRRLLLKNRDIGLFCNLSESTLTDGAVFQQLLDFLDANRAIAPSVVLEFTQSALRSAGPIENESLSALADRGFRFSLDNLQDLRIEPRELAARGFRYIKIPGNLLLHPKDTTSDIHPADLSDLLGRFGIDLVAEKIESEAMVVDLLDCDVRFGQGFLFSPPRPVRAEALQGIADRSDVIVRETSPAEEPTPVASLRYGGEAPLAHDSATNGAGTNGAGTSPRLSGLARLARTATGRI